MLGYLRTGSKRTKAIWLIVTVATVFTFLIGFSFFGSMGSDSSRARQSGVYGEINGDKVTREMWQGALASAIQGYRQQYDADPVDRDLKSVEQRAWRTLVNERLFSQEASKAGIKVTDADVVVGMRTTPPQVLYTVDAFQTNGKFDPSKYQAALANPNQDWSPFEEQLRQELPVRRLQERLMSSLKLSEAELRESFRDRFERMTATVLQVPPADTGSSAGTPAELKAIYEKYRSRMSSPARTQLELLSIPMQYSADEVKDATDRAQGLYDRAIRGEDWNALALDNSEGPNAAKGGVVDRFISPSELGPVGETIAAHKPGDILLPFREGGQVIMFRILDPARDSVARNAPAGTVKLGQIVIKIRPSSDALRKQFTDAQQIAKRAKQVGLSKAATEKGLATEKTQLFDQNNLPPQLYVAPDAAEWGLNAKKGEVSPVYNTGDAFLIAQVALQHAAGPPTQEEVQDQLKQIADVDRRVELSKPRADQVAQALKAGQTLEQAAQAAGLATMPVQLTRAQPDPRLFVSPEFQGALWGAKPGQVVGPVRSAGGWYFGRVENVASPPDSLFNDQMKGQITTEILTRRQRAFFDGYLTMLRQRSKVVDARSAFGE
jgi:parvulin-like peptidyl-prolyl isomerase